MIVVRVTLVAALVGGCSTGSSTAGPTTTGSPTGHNADCRSFGGETVDAVAWSSAGDFLAVSTSADADGQGRIRSSDGPT
jgi:hypothetical protein